MSSVVMNTTQRSSHLPSPMTRSFLLNMPEEVLYDALCLLPFWQRVVLSQTCRRLRSLALAHKSLWQTLPIVEGVSRLRTLEPFIERSGDLGFDLYVEGTIARHVATLCRWLEPRFHRIRALHIFFDNHTKPKAAALKILHSTLAAPAPLLEDLSLAGPTSELPFLGSLWPDILGGVVSPKLRRVDLSAFTFDAPCPALQGVTTVVATVGALAPKVSAAENHRVHALFPAIEHLELEGLHAVEDIAIARKHARPIARVPVLDAPLLSLSLGWRECSEGEDFHAAEWLERSFQHVREVRLDDMQCGPSVQDAVLSSILDHACALHIETWSVHGSLELSLRSAATRRSAFVNVAQAEALLKKFIQQPKRLQLDTLVLSADALSFSLMKTASESGSWAALQHLCTLSLELQWSSVGEDGWFVSPETLSSLDPMPNITVLHVGVSSTWENYGRAPPAVDCCCILRLLERVLANVASVVVSLPRDLLTNYELLSGVQGFEFRNTPVF